MFKSKRIPLALTLLGFTGMVNAANIASSEHSGAFDMAIADEHKLIEMLKKSGKISANASLNDAETALRSYLKTRQQQERKKAAQLD